MGFSFKYITLRLINYTKIYIFDRYRKIIKQINPFGRFGRNVYWKPTASSDYWFTTDYFDKVEIKI
jgi:gliding motility-associated-like protein